MYYFEYCHSVFTWYWGLSCSSSNRIKVNSFKIFNPNVLIMSIYFVSMSIAPSSTSPKGIGHMQHATTTISPTINVLCSHHYYSRLAIHSPPFPYFEVQPVDQTFVKSLIPFLPWQTDSMVLMYHLKYQNQQNQY